MGDVFGPFQCAYRFSILPALDKHLEEGQESFETGKFELAGLNIYVWLNSSFKNDQAMDFFVVEDPDTKAFVMLSGRSGSHALNNGIVSFSLPIQSVNDGVKSLSTKLEKSGEFSSIDMLSTTITHLSAKNFKKKFPLPVDNKGAECTIVCNLP